MSLNGAGVSTVYFWDSLDSFGARAALLDNSAQSLSFSELANAADALLRGTSRSLILIEMDNSIASIIALMAALRARCPAILTNVDARQAAALIDHYRPCLQWSPTRGLQTTEAQNSLAGDDLHPDLAIMLSTSGSTGTAKLVRLSADAVDANARSIATYLQLGPSDRAITTLPPAYSYGLSVINSHMCVGGSIRLHPRSVVDPEFATLIAAEQITNFAGVPYTYEMLHKTAFFEHPPPSIRLLTQAGGRLAPELVAEIGRHLHMQGRQFFIMYGQTEATARMAYLPPDQLSEHPDCIGRPIPGGSFELVDVESGEPTDQRGELVYSGPNVMMGYAQTPSDLALGRKIARLHTGDIAERVRSGLFRITGRKSRFIKLFGLRVALDEVESQASAQGWAIVATGNDDMLVLASEEPGIARQAAAHFSRKFDLPGDRFVALEVTEIPRNSSGKVNFPHLMELAREVHSHPVDQTSSVERLRAFYVAIANREVDDDVSFMSLEGDSLSYVQATILIEDALGTLPLHWEQLSLGDLAKLAAAKGDSGRTRSLFRIIEGEMLVRCLAIMSITLNHSWYPDRLIGISLFGGANVLLILFGYNFYRFRGSAMLGDHPWKAVWSLSRRYILPYYPVLVFLSLLQGFDWRNFLLIGTWWSGPQGALHMYWFFEAIFQLSVIIAALFSIGVIRRGVKKAPGTGLFIAFVAAVALRLVLDHLRQSTGLLAPRTPDAFLYLCFAGMVLASSQSVMLRLLAAALTIACAFLIHLQLYAGLLMVAAFTLIIFCPRIPLPTPLAMLVRLIARYTIYIYLFSRIVMAVVHRIALINDPMTESVLVLIVGIGAGMIIDRIGIILLKIRERFQYRQINGHSASYVVE